jgi:LmbE family N-acetylglucosaminyl deacetylase
MPAASEYLTRLDHLPVATWETITSGENVLILAPHPADESVRCGGVIARCCRRGRPPFVMVLTDGSASPSRSGMASPEQLANLRERETRAATHRLGLPAHRLLMAGLFEGTVPSHGPAFDAVVAGVALVTWARDCNVICSPWPDAGAQDQVGAYRIAVAVAKRTGIELLVCLDPSRPPTDLVLPDEPLRGWRLDITPELAAKREAIAEHVSRLGGVETSKLEPWRYEVFIRLTAASASAERC